jgi:hypothetical protein
MGCSNTKIENAESHTDPELTDRRMAVDYGLRNANEAVLDFGRLMKDDAGREALLRFAQSEYVITKSPNTPHRLP